MTTDEEFFLLSKLKEGNMSAMEVLYIRHAPQVKSFVSAIMKNDADTEDLVHDIFIKVWEERSKICNVNSFKSYLYAMTRNMVYNRLKHERVHRNYVMNLINRNAESNEIEERIVTKNLLEHINSEMEGLTEQQRIIYELSRNGDKTYKEISEIMGISPKTVQYHIGNVLSKLKKLL